MSDNELLKELRKISKILVLSNAAALEAELAKIASTAERRRMWVLIDGNRLANRIAEEAGVTSMAASYFLNELETAGFIEYVRQAPPRKIFDYVPPSWLG